MTTATAAAGVDQEVASLRSANQPQEPGPKGESSTAPDDAYEVRVALTIAVPYRGRHPGIDDAWERVVAALKQEEPLPDGSYIRGDIDVRVRTAKEIRTDNARAAKRRRDRGEPS